MGGGCVGASRIAHGSVRPRAAVTRVGSEEKLEDVAELNDIPSPIKPSSNGYSYDGPVYDAGSADALGKVEIKEDGVYRLQVRDLFGGTRRSTPRLPADHSQADPRFLPGRVGSSYEPTERRSQRTLQTDRGSAPGRRWRSRSWSCGAMGSTVRSSWGCPTCPRASRPAA